MVNNPPKFPCVMKMGFHHHGLGKLKVENLVHFQELLSVLACVDTYLTVEPYIDAKCDVHIQKIGSNYKAFMRKSISGGWRSNIGSAMLEQVPVNEKYKILADEVSNLFGGLDLVAIELVETKSNEQFIYEVTGSQFTIMGETQEEDRRLISELLTNKMQQTLSSQLGGQIPKRSSITQLPDDLTAGGQGSPLPQPEATQQPSFTSRPSGPTGSFLQRMGSISGSIGNTLTSVASNAPGANILTNKFGSNTSIETSGNTSSTPSHIQQQVTDTVGRFFRRASQTTNDDSPLTDGQRPVVGGEQQATGPADGTEDTMKNLRKTFANIFKET